MSKVHLTVPSEMVFWNDAEWNGQRVAWVSKKTHMVVYTSSLIFILRQAEVYHEWELPRKVVGRKTAGS